MLPCGAFQAVLSASLPQASPLVRLPRHSRPCTHKSRFVNSGWPLSALRPKTDIRQRIEHVCFVPEADIGLGQICCSMLLVGCGVLFANVMKAEHPWSLLRSRFPRDFGGLSPLGGEV
jgi:hypothetical protein